MVVCDLLSYSYDVMRLFRLCFVDQVFNCLYKELYYRHIYARLQPTLEQRFGSWQNYTDLFSALLCMFVVLFALMSDRDAASEGVSFELPDAWLWDILDEYIYQFQAFCQYKHKIKAKTQEEMDRISGSPDVRTHNACSVPCLVAYCLLWCLSVCLRACVCRYGRGHSAAACALVDKSNIRTFLERESVRRLAVFACLSFVFVLFRIVYSPSWHAVPLIGHLFQWHARERPGIDS